MINEQLNQETLKKLRAPLPPEAIKPHPTKPYLSQINAIYVVDRLNDVFGLGGWRIKNEIVEKADRMVVIKSVFTAWIPGSQPTDPDIYIEAYGGNDNADLGDAYKGACTDALTKIGSYLGIASDVWKDVYKGAKQSTQTQGGATPAYTGAAIKWINKGTPEWTNLAKHIANAMKGGTTMDTLLKTLRDKHNQGISSKDKPAMETEVTNINNL